MLKQIFILNQKEGSTEHSMGCVCCLQVEGRSGKLGKVSSDIRESRMWSGQCQGQDVCVAMTGPFRSAKKRLVTDVRKDQQLAGAGRLGPWVQITVLWFGGRELLCCTTQCLSLLEVKPTWCLFECLNWDWLKAFERSGLQGKAAVPGFSLLQIQTAQFWSPTKLGSILKTHSLRNQLCCQNHVVACRYNRDLQRRPLAARWCCKPARLDPLSETLRDAFWSAEKFALRLLAKLSIYCLHRLKVKKENQLWGACSWRPWGRGESRQVCTTGPVFFFCFFFLLCRVRSAEVGVMWLL